MTSTYRTERSKAGKIQARLNREHQQALADGRVVRFFVPGAQVRVVAFETAAAARAAVAAHANAEIVVL